MAKKRNRKESKEPINFWNSFFFKFSSKLLLGLAVIVIFLTFTQCTVKKPESPVWNTSLVVPVINHTYDMEEIIRRIDQPEISVDSLGNIAYSTSQDLDTVFLDQSNLTTSNLSYSLAQQLGPIDITPPAIAPVTVDLSTISGLATALPGDSAFIDTLHFQLYNDMPTINNFSQATISNGQLIASVTNNLDVSLDTIIIQIYDINSASVIATDTFPAPINSGSSANLPINLNGKTISNSLRLDLSCYTPGGIVDSASYRNITSGISFGSSLTVSSAVAEVPPLNDISFSQKVGINLKSGEKIDSANINQGNLNLNIVNGTALDASLNITISGIVNNGVTFSIIQPIPAGQTMILDTNLANFSFIPQNDSIDINIIASISGSNGTFVNVNESDSFQVSATIGNLTFNTVSGVFNNDSANFTGVNKQLNIPDGFDNITLKTAILTLDVENGIDLPGVLNIQISGSNGKTINLTGDIAPKGINVTTLSSITNDSVADFLSPLPDSIGVTGTIRFGDGVYQSTITKDDFVSAQVNFYAPLEVKINNAQLNDLNISKSAIDQNNINIITDHATEARFIYNVTNHLPLGAKAIIYLSHDSASLYTNPQVSLDTIYIDPAPVSLTTGIVSGDSITTGEIYLDSLDIQVLKNDTLFVRQDVFLNSSDTSGVKLTSNDYLTITGRIEVVYRFDGKF
ncbi:MAG: hypothetical protein GXO93_07295 [FCB group bacterium]|nr:hypothetical protein [FCB group bacterium]